MELEVKPDRYVVHFPAVRATRESTREKRGQPGKRQRIGRETKNRKGDEWNRKGDEW